MYFLLDRNSWYHKNLDINIKKKHVYKNCECMRFPNNARNSLTFRYKTTLFGKNLLGKLYDYKQAK